MSNIYLVSYASFRKDDKTSKITLYRGVDSCSVDDSGLVRMVAGNVALPSDCNLDPPGGGLLMLYGSRDTREEVSLRRMEAREKGLSFEWIEADAEISQIYPGIVNEAILPTIDFVNVRRMSSSLQDTILNYFSGYVSVKYDSTISKQRIQQIAQRPDLFDQLCSEPEFRHINIFVIPIFDGARVKQLAYVRPSARIVAVRQDQTDDVVLSLPDWLPIQSRREERTRTS